MNPPTIPPRRRTERVAPYFAGLFLVLLSASGGALAFYNYEISMQNARRSTGDMLAAIARSAAGALDGDQLSRLYGIDSEGQPDVRRFAGAEQRDDFQFLRRQLQTAIDAQRFLGFSSNNLYVFVKDPEQPGQLRWALMAHARPFVGERYAARLEMDEVLAGKASSAFTSIYLSSASGREWISAYAPIRDSRGAIVGLLEAALDVASVQRAARAQADRTLGFAIGVIAIVFTAMFALLHYLLRARQARNQVERINREMRVANLNLNFANQDLKAERERLAHPPGEKAMLAAFQAEKSEYRLAAAPHLIEEWLRRTTANLPARLHAKEIDTLRAALRALLQHFAEEREGELLRLSSLLGRHSFSVRIAGVTAEDGLLQQTGVSAVFDRIERRQSPAAIELHRQLVGD
ncbi:MAG: hypothetical protein K1X75_09760 [Leptospirales bacterium]|nr:hypothetical protein [Leptospirales bacterium]